MTILVPYTSPTLEISISKIRSTVVEIQSLSVTIGEVLRLGSKITFLPSTYCISILDSQRLCVLDIRNSDCLLEEWDYFASPQFSSDGSFFAALHGNRILIWKRTSGSYTFFGYGDIWFLSHEDTFRFSPTLSSILSHHKNFLWVWCLHDSSTTHRSRCKYAAISRSCSHIVTAYESESTVTIINLHSQVPSQFINTGVEIDGLVITGNVILVADSFKTVAWLLTGAGMVDGVFYNKRADHNDSIWTAPLPSPTSSYVNVHGQIGAIQVRKIPPFNYNIETGQLVHGHQDFSDSLASSSYELYRSSRYHYFCYLYLPNTLAEGGWLISHAKRGAGWVIDPEGRHRFWVPVEWRKDWRPENWHYNITTLFIDTSDCLIMIKF